jgi:Flp pilus assembly protein TadB
MPLEVLVPFLAVFVGAALLFLALWLLVASRLARRREHLTHRLGEEGEPGLAFDESVLGGRPRGVGERVDRAFEEMITRTGLDLDGAVALAVILFSGVLLAAVVFVWRYEEEPWLAIPAFLLGAAVPLAFFWWKQRRWRRTLQSQLPDAFFLLARSLRAGRSIDQAIRLVGQQGVVPLAREFARMDRQLTLGLSLGQVLQIAAARLRLLDFNIFASVLSLHRATGGNLPSILDRLAASTRDRNQFEGQYRAATVLGRYSAGFIIALVGVLLIYLFFFQRQWAVQFLDTSQGYVGLVMFLTAMALEAAGLLLLFWFLKHDY